MQFVPDVFLIGAPKCGTTALSHWLRDHPELFLPDRKEPHHFSGPFPEDRHKNPVMDPVEYAALYEGAEGLTIDASTSYLASEKALATIKQLNPAAKIIICLRNPIKQVWSGFMMMEKFGHREPTAWLEEQLAGHATGTWMQPIESALYGKYVPAWQEFDVHIIESENMRKNGQAVFDDVCEFLGVAKTTITQLDSAKANKFRTPRGRMAQAIFNSKSIAKVARKITPLKLRQAVGDALLKPAKKPEMPESFPTLLWPIFEPDLNILRAETNNQFPTLGP